MNTSYLLNIIILTFNSENSIEEVIKSCNKLSDNIYIIDSFSSDKTVEISKKLGCHVVQHPFENYSIQRNWSQKYITELNSNKFCDTNRWFLHIDSDEVISPELAQSIKNVLLNSDSEEIDGYLIRRQSYFMGHPIRFGHLNPSWHLRLFKAEVGKCEDRLYDQHFIVPGTTKKLKGLLLDLQLVSLENWTNSHNRWSSAEAREILNSNLSTKKDSSTETLTASLVGDVRMQKRWLKNNLYYRSPLLFRAFVFFVYSYFLKLGFLDGRIGTIYHVLQAFWFRFLTDSKIIEQQELEKK